MLGSQTFGGKRNLVCSPTCVHDVVVICEIVLQLDSHLELTFETGISRPFWIAHCNFN